ncbi:MAG: VCBS repeat-containing protein, partial [Candidatus Thiodiazotropha sp. (ex Semelilucina semeliformis)]|nr:VCBS repeat-containing protein [Candidatus Thiodiazotropha sp. (ex Semelilucina semeliformis)]
THFSPKEPWVIGNYGYSAGGWRVKEHPRLLVDVDGDGKADIVGFDNDGVDVTLASGQPFSSLLEFGGDSWDTYRNPRYLSDVNGDGLPDIVGFANDGVRVSYSTGSSFESPMNLLSDFIQTTQIVNYQTGTTTIAFEKWLFRRMLDVNGDGLADIIGYRADGIVVSYSTGKGFLNAEVILPLDPPNEGGLLPSRVLMTAGDWYEVAKLELTDINGDACGDMAWYSDKAVTAYFV